MKALKELLMEYGESHQNPANVFIHWVCVPLIFWSITGFLFLITVPYAGNLAIPALLLISLYYICLSRTLWLGMLIFGCICLIASYVIYVKFYEGSFYIFLSIFSIAWIAQFIGHKIEGKKPAFLKDIQFLLLGPAWLMAKLYRKAGIPL